MFLWMNHEKRYTKGYINHYSYEHGFQPWIHVEHQVNLEIQSNQQAETAVSRLVPRIFSQDDTMNFWVENHCQTTTKPLKNHCQTTIEPLQNHYEIS